MPVDIGEGYRVERRFLRPCPPPTHRNSPPHQDCTMHAPGREQGSQWGSVMNWCSLKIIVMSSLSRLTGFIIIQYRK
jgi:hypothetical protein